MANYNSVFSLGSLFATEDKPQNNTVTQATQTDDHAALQKASSFWSHLTAISTCAKNLMQDATSLAYSAGQLVFQVVTGVTIGAHAAEVAMGTAFKAAVVEATAAGVIATAAHAVKDVGVKAACAAVANPLFTTAVCTASVIALNPEPAANVGKGVYNVVADIAGIGYHTGAAAGHGVYNGCEALRDYVIVPSEALASKIYNTEWDLCS